MCRADPGSAIDELVGKKLERLRGRELTRRFARYDRPVFEFELGGGRARSEVQLVEVDPEDGRAKGGFEKIAPRARIGKPFARSSPRCSAGPDRRVPAPPRAADQRKD